MTLVTGIILEEEGPLSLDDLCRLCAVEREFITGLVEEGLLEAESAVGPRFVGRSLRRVRTAVRLRRDLGVNVAGAALVVELLERIEVLEGQQGGFAPED